MHCSAALVLVLCLASCSGKGASFKTAEPGKGDSHEPGVELVRNYHVLEMRGNKEEVTGSCSLMVRREASRLMIEESCTADAHGKTAAWSSTVAYETGSMPHPVWAVVTTTFRKTVVMTGRVDFMKDAAEIEATIHAGTDGKPKEKADAKRETQPVQGPVLVLSTMEVTAPLMLGQAGILKDLVIAELPDDIDEVVHFTPGCTLTRSEPDASGAFTMKAGCGDSEDDYFTADFDQDGLLTSLIIDNEIKIVPADKDGD